MACFRTCPEINQFIWDPNSLGDDLWPYLSGLKQLKQLSQGYDKLPVQGLGISKLNREALDDLFLGNAKIVDAALAEIGTFTGLTGSISMPPRSLTRVCRRSPRSKNSSTSMCAAPTSLRPDWPPSKGAPLISLGYGIRMTDFTEQLPQVAALFPRLERLILPREVNPTVED